MEHVEKPGLNLNALPARKKLLCDPQSVTSGILHFFGAALAITALVVLLVLSLKTGGGARKIVSFSIFGASSILLFAASGVYHTFYVSERVHRTLRKLDHCMIYILIAGTYTPLCLVTLQGWVGWTLFGLVWGLAIGGLVLKISWIEAPRLLSTLTYVLMGWAALLAIFPLWQNMALGGLLWLFGGGVIYTLGAVGYNYQIPKINSRYFGDHELFHVLILLGWGCHFVMMLRYVL